MWHPLLSELEGYYRQLDGIFSRLKMRYPQEISCRRGCNHCCQHLVDIYLSEALLLNLHCRSLKRKKRRALERRAALHLKALERRVGERELCLEEEALQGRAQRLQGFRLLCPLNEQGDCLLYEARPAICRIYGLLLADGRKGTFSHCTQNFRRLSPGQVVEAVPLDEVMEAISRLDRRLLMELGGKAPPALQKVYIGTALTTDFEGLSWQSLVLELSSLPGRQAAGGGVVKVSDV
ncbi:MAG: hypothetical protein ACE5LX_04425 [Nitrospinota bacterium]